MRDTQEKQFDVRTWLIERRSMYQNRKACHIHRYNVLTKQMQFTLIRSITRQIPYATCNQISHCHVRASTWVVEQGRWDLELALQQEQQENLQISSFSVASEDHHHSVPSSFQILPCQVNTQEKGMKFTLSNSLMHDTDEHNFYVWQPHCRRMEYVRKS